MGNNILAGKIDALDVRIKALVPDLDVHVIHTAMQRNACVIEQNIDMAESIHDRLDGGFDAFLIRDVALDGDHAAAGFFCDLIFERFQLFDSSRKQRNVRTGFGIGKACVRAEAGTSTRNDCDLTGQVKH